MPASAVTALRVTALQVTAARGPARLWRPCVESHSIMCTGAGTAGHAFKTLPAALPPAPGTCAGTDAVTVRMQDVQARVQPQALANKPSSKPRQPQHAACCRPHLRKALLQVVAAIAGRQRVGGAQALRLRLHRRGVGPVAAGILSEGADVSVENGTALSLWQAVQDLVVDGHKAEGEDLRQRCDNSTEGPSVRLAAGRGATGWPLDKPGCCVHLGCIRFPTQRCCAPFRYKRV